MITSPLPLLQLLNFQVNPIVVMATVPPQSSHFSILA